MFECQLRLACRSKAPCTRNFRNPTLNTIVFAGEEENEVLKVGVFGAYLRVNELCSTFKQMRKMCIELSFVRFPRMKKMNEQLL